MNKHQWRRSRISTAGRQSREDLVDTITSTLARNIEDGYSVKEVAGKLGTVVIQRGSAFPGVLHNGLPVFMTLVDRRLPVGQRIVDVQQRIGAVISHARIAIEPFEPNLFVIKDVPNSAADDRDMTHRIQGVVYTLDESRIAFEQLMRAPQSYGIPYGEVYDTTY